MKTKIKHILIMLAMTLVFFGCCRETPLSEIKLSQSELILEVGQEEKIFLSGGNGSYTISPGTSAIAEVKIEGKVLSITARKAGFEVFTITSAKQTAKLKVTVKATSVPIPNLGTLVGIYTKEQNMLFTYSMTAKTKNGIWLCEKSQNPYGKRCFLSSYKEGASELLIITEGLSPMMNNTGDQGKVFKVKKEKDLEGKKVQLWIIDTEFRIITLKAE